MPVETTQKSALLPDIAILAAREEYRQQFLSGALSRKGLDNRIFKMPGVHFANCVRALLSGATYEQSLEAVFRGGCADEFIPSRSMLAAFWKRSDFQQILARAVSETPAPLAEDGQLLGTIILRGGKLVIECEPRGLLSALISKGETL